MKIALTTLAALASFVQPVLADILPTFAEETATSGIASSFTGEWEFMVGGGAATFDCNADGLQDVLLSGGTSPANFYRNTSTKFGELHFEKFASGLELERVTGTYPIDIDSDGNIDVVLLRVGENVVMRGIGQCQFERANEAWGFAGGDAWSTAFAATFEKEASFPTIAIGNYIDRLEEISPWGSCTENWLHRPTGQATKFEKPTALTPSYCALSMLFTDWNRSGTPSLRVSNDREYYEGGQEQMWHVKPGAAPTLYTEAEGWKPLRIWGMGIASYDLDSDTYPEYFLTSMADNKLQTVVEVPSAGMPAATFKDVAFAKGVTAHRPFMGQDLKPSTAWHTQFEDVNNDGRVDLFIAKGNVDRMPDFAAADPNNLLLQTAEGKFVEAADKAGVASIATSRGAALADFNNDGLLDLVVVNRNAPAQIWRNTTMDAGHWLQLKLAQPGTNRDAIGAWIEVKLGEKIIRREITSGGGHASGQAGPHHFGLGAELNPQVRVIWPDGKTSEWQVLDADQFHTITSD